MSTTKTKSEAEKYLEENEFEINEFGAYLYVSQNGKSSVNLEIALTTFNTEQTVKIKDLKNEIFSLTKDICDLEDDIQKKDNQIYSLENDMEDIYEKTKDLSPNSLIDEKRIEIIKRLYKHLTLDELEAIEAPFKEKVGLHRHKLLNLKDAPNKAR